MASSKARPRCLLLDTGQIAAVMKASRSDARDLSEALVTSGPWRSFAGDAAVVYSLDPLRMALMGFFDDADEARIAALQTQLDIGSRGFRFVSYRDAEVLVTTLAVRLVEQSGDRLRSAALVAIPRGGHVVLGMLTYALTGGRLDDSAAADTDLWIVVDDCSISGARFLQWLADHPGPDVVFAHLYSHPDLRGELERHPRVRACIAADDLIDHAPARLGDGYAEWRAAWRDRGSGVWAGQTDRIAFAWNEPDTGIWNSFTGEIERGWHLVGPRHCLKNRRPLPDGAIQQVFRGAGDLRAGPKVMWADLGEEVLLADIGSGAVVGLSGAGAAMWRESIDATSKAEALARLGALFDVEATRLAADYDEFVENLVAAGIVAVGGE